MIRNHHVTSGEVANFVPTEGRWTPVAGADPSFVFISASESHWVRYGRIVIAHTTLVIDRINDASQGGMGAHIARGLPFPSTSVGGAASFTGMATMTIRGADRNNEQLLASFDRVAVTWMSGNSGIGINKVHPHGLTGTVRFTAVFGIVYVTEE